MQTANDKTVAAPAPAKQGVTFFLLFFVGLLLGFIIGFAVKDFVIIRLERTMHNAVAHENEKTPTDKTKIPAVQKPVKLGVTEAQPSAKVIPAEIPAPGEEKKEDENKEPEKKTEGDTKATGETKPAGEVKPAE